MHLIRRLRIFKTIFYNVLYTEQGFGSRSLPFKRSSQQISQNFNFSEIFIMKPVNI